MKLTCSENRIKSCPSIWFQCKKDFIMMKWRSKSVLFQKQESQNHSRKKRKKRKKYVHHAKVVIMILIKYY